MLVNRSPLTPLSVRPFAVCQHTKRCWPFRWVFSSTSECFGGEWSRLPVLERTITFQNRECLGVARLEILPLIVFLASIIPCSHSLIVKLIFTLEYRSFQMDGTLLYSFQSRIGSWEQPQFENAVGTDKVVQVIFFMWCQVGLEYFWGFSPWLFPFFCQKTNKWLGKDIGLRPVDDISFVYLFIYLFLAKLQSFAFWVIPYHHKSSDLGIPLS